MKQECIYLQNKNLGEKFIVIALVVSLCVSLWGCGPREESQYDEEKNQSVSFQGLYFQVPREWKKIENESDEAMMFFIETDRGDSLKNYLMLDFFEDESIKEHLATLKEADYVKIVQQASTSIADMAAEKIELVKDAGDDNYKFEVIVLQMKHGIAEISFYSANDIGYQDFEKVVASLKNK